MHTRHLITLAALTLTSALIAAPGPLRLPGRRCRAPRTASRIWRASGRRPPQRQPISRITPQGITCWLDVRGSGAGIPYQPWAAAKKAQNFRNRQTADPLSKCYMPGVPRIMYLDFPFQIFQTPQAIAMTFEWSLDYRLIYTDGSPHPADVNFWMGDSRGKWEGDTLVVDVANHNDQTWFDMAGDFHSDALHVVERYRMTDADTIQYEATIEDSKVFNQPWTIRFPLQRRRDRDRLFEYACQAELEEANGLFTREARTWYPGDGTPAFPGQLRPLLARLPTRRLGRICRRTADGRPDWNGFFDARRGGANYGLEKRARTGLTPEGRGLIVDPPDGPFLCSLGPCRKSRIVTSPDAVTTIPRRTAFRRVFRDRCTFLQPFQIRSDPRLRRVSARTDLVAHLALNGRDHLPDSIRFGRGIRSVTGKETLWWWIPPTSTARPGSTRSARSSATPSTWWSVSRRRAPIKSITRPPSPIRLFIRSPGPSHSFRRAKFELTEAACHEEDHDLPHLKAIKDAAAGKK